MKNKSMLAVFGASVCLAAIAGCGSSSPSASGTTTVKSGELSGICPSTVEIQQNWTPEAEQGAYYELAASGGNIDSDQKTYTAPLLDPTTGKQTGVSVELLAGGPATGYSNPEQLLYENQSILLGVDATDTQIQSYAKTPTVGVVTPMNLYDNVFFWNPAKHSFSSIADIGSSGATLLSYGTGGALNLYLEAKGELHHSQIDGAYNGSPADFVASGGALVSGGYATYEPYYYSHQLSAWNKPIAYQLIETTGYNPYSNTTFVTPANLKKYAKCLSKLVPMIQQAQISYLKSPSRANQLIVQLATAYKIGGGYNMAVAQYADQTMLADKIVSNPSSGAFGSFDMNRVNTLIGQLQATKSVTGLPSGFSASTLETNKFIDPKVSMTFYTGPYNNASGVITEKP
ncbi:MAG TPA: hypothetical protein VGH27_23490 [Streptosporangiaceae bacterium]|jgi:hypothetical protein